METFDEDSIRMMQLTYLSLAMGVFELGAEVAGVVETVLFDFFAILVRVLRFVGPFLAFARDFFAIFLFCLLFNHNDPYI